MKKQPHTITAAELMTELRLDSNFVAQQQELEKIHNKQVENFHRAERPIVDALEKIGLKIRSIGDITNASPHYIDAVPILLGHLQKSYPDDVKAAIAYAMAYPEASIAWDILVAKFKETPNTSTSFKDALATAIIMTMTNSAIHEVMDLAKDRKNGPARVILLGALKKSKLPEVEQALKLLATDPDLVKEISSWSKTSRKRK